MIVGLAIFMSMAIPLATASDSKAKNRTAADAAAMASAAALIEAIPLAMVGHPWPGSWTGVGVYLPTPGAVAAADNFAAANDGEVVYWHSDLVGSTWGSTVKVRSKPVEGHLPRSLATAEFTLPVCVVTPAGPVAGTTTLTCDGVPYVIVPTGLTLDQATAIVANVKPHLVD